MDLARLRLSEAAISEPDTFAGLHQEPARACRCLQSHPPAHPPRAMDDDLPKRENQSDGKGRGKGKDAEPGPDRAPAHAAADTTNAGASLHRIAQSAASLLMSGRQAPLLAAGVKRAGHHEPGRLWQEQARARFRCGLRVQAAIP